jgi:hypothetical protein
MFNKMFRWLKSKFTGKKVSGFDKDNPFLIL